MLAKCRHYTLPGTPELHATVNVIPTGMVHVEILENRQSIDADFEQLSFKTHGRMTDLVCYSEAGKKECWNLGMNSEDARDLAKLIESAEEELEILMRDL
ncbi:hypothetical protein [Thaumasiovibrio subtropicus]|uniref:hypothetical protein n=1 Tax=Thaumasiovibrio subtropicus TaxID=1891207 RepID=UPI000B364AE3|nr:hypothetical protein [Thaumasiovibrio subtropicus]